MFSHWPCYRSSVSHIGLRQYGWPWICKRPIWKHLINNIILRAMTYLVHGNFVNLNNLTCSWCSSKMYGVGSWSHNMCWWQKTVSFEVLMAESCIFQLCWWQKAVSTSHVDGRKPYWLLRFSAIKIKCQTCIYGFLPSNWWKKLQLWFLAISI